MSDCRISFCFENTGIFALKRKMLHWKLVTHPATDYSQRCLTVVTGGESIVSTWYDKLCLINFFIASILS